ncbi:MAG: hypothetical protein KF912_12370 [Phycisphaeraceae bacterium]|nr:hypothetical protein [Phycisphaeraceae bacterium]MBX3368098.1 hypothetical protein [Phycisphaeraceae bacterium]
MPPHRDRPEWNRVRLNAASEGALAESAVHDMVVASAEGIAERTGVRLVSIEADESGITAIVEGDRLAALGLAAELRRLTGAWYARRHPGERLWHEPPQTEDETDTPPDTPHDGPDTV